jgi:translation initiation factor IF-2
MAAAKKIKLFKIASEINIGKDAIVDFLQNKGFDIQNKPTATMTPEMIDAVYEKFKREKRAAEIQRDKIEKHKKIRKPEEEISEQKEKDQKTQKEKETIKKQQEEITETEKEIKEKKDKPPKKETKVKDKEKPIEKITKKKATKKKEKLGKEEKEKIDKKEKSAKDEKVEKAKQLKDTKKSADEKKTKKKEPEKLEKKKTVKEEKITTEKIDEEKKEKIEKYKEDKEELNRQRPKKRRKRKKIAEVEIEEGESPKLKGLTIVGKIELTKEQEKLIQKQKEVKPLEFEEEDLLSGKKAKSKKKKKDKAERRRKKRLSVRELISEEDVDKALRETLSEMSESSTVSQRSKMRHRRKVEREEKELKKKEAKQQEAKILQLTEFVTTAALAELINVSPNDIILKCMELGLMVTLNQRLDKDTIILIADDYGHEVVFHDEKSAQLIIEEENEEDPKDLKPRSPIVTVMGHVDHGKTSLLDFIRYTKVVAGEAGGITQHIGAYRVELDNDKAITFLDTPGHEAFTAMRARGAQVTDIVVLVVAADDSVMPQTLEAISHAQAANVPIVVAINKIDKPDANPERIKQQLSEKNILVEDWGGKYQCIDISAKKGTNVDILLEKILLEAEMLDLKANPDRHARAAIVEANMDKGLGAVSTVIVQKGMLKIGDPFVAGVSSGRVRAMFDERGIPVYQAGPSIPVRVIGFNSLPEAGDVLLGLSSDFEARAISNERQQLKREQQFRQMHLMTLDDISKQIQIGGIKDLYLIIKGDVQGSVEALSDSLQKQSTDEVRVIILHKGVGAITESDVMLAVASKAVIIGFQVSPTANARKLAEKESVDIRLYNIIYDAINEIRLALEGLLTPELREDITATVEIRKVFRISKLGYIAGCFVKEGKIHRNDRVRLLRDGLPVYNGTINSLKREKEDVKEVDTNFECGIMLDGFNDIEVGDIIEAYKLLEIKRTLT